MAYHLPRRNGAYSNKNRELIHQKDLLGATASEHIMGQSGNLSFSKPTWISHDGSMYAIYGDIYHQYTPNVSIYTIHGSYGYEMIWNTLEHLPFDPLAASFAIIFHGTPSVFRTVYVLTSWRRFLHWNDACRCYSNMEGTYLAKKVGWVWWSLLILYNIPLWLFNVAKDNHHFK